MKGWYRYIEYSRYPSVPDMLYCDGYNDARNGQKPLSKLKDYMAGYVDGEGDLCSIREQEVLAKHGLV